MRADPKTGATILALRMLTVVIAAAMLQGCQPTCEDEACPAQPATDPYLHDIAVLKLDTASASLDATTRALLRAVPPVAIATAADQWSENDTVGIVGFGLTRAGAMDTPIKRTAIIFAKACSNPEFDESICFSVEATGTAVCGGDSGGPMLRPRGNVLVLIGVASRTESSCGSGEGIYVDVSRPQYRDWLKPKLSTWVPPTGHKLEDITPPTAAHGAVTVGQPDPTATVAVSNAPHIGATINFPKKKLDAANSILEVRDFVLSLSGATTTATCMNDNAEGETVRYCLQAPVPDTSWTATVAPRSGDSGIYQMAISALENVGPGSRP